MKASQIEVGSHVILYLVDRAGNKERLEVDIVPDGSADYIHGFLGESTLLGKALIGENAGSVIPYLKDDIYAIEIITVSPSTRIPPENLQGKRQSTMDKTIREVEHTNAVLFASSFSGKWGDYDPDSLPAINTPEENEPED